MNLADVGVVGGLTESDEIAKATPPYHMGRAMGSGSGLGISGFTSAGGDDFFTSPTGQDYQFGGFQK